MQTPTRAAPIRALLPAVLLTLAALQAQAQSRVAGFLDGAFSSDQRGAAVFSIPIAVPPGTGGMEPELTLLYNSHGENGLLGVGWNLAGLPSIARCPPVYALSGRRAPLMYDASDRLCLDGAQLVAVAGSYWGADAVYHTEKDARVRITPDGQGFVMQSPQGRRMSFGATADSRILAPGQTGVRIWALSAAADRFGNTVTYQYTNNPNGMGQYYPTQIDYTFNAAAPLAHHRRVTFDYDLTRPDVTTQWSGGAPIRTSVRLNGVTTWMLDPNPRTVGRYAIGYTQSPSTGRSLAESVTRCDADNNCFAPTALTWQAGANTLRSQQQIGAYSFGGGGKPAYGWHDFNGDELPDLTATSDSVSDPVQVVLMQPGGRLAGAPTDLGAQPCSGGDYRWIDFDGDEKTDLACTPKTASQLHWVRLSTGTGLGPQISFGALSCNGQLWSWADFNGDARADLICDAPGARSVRLSEGGALAPAITLTSFDPGDSSTTWADFNGDGQADMLVDQSRSPFGHYTLISTGTGVGSPVSLGNLGDANTTFAWVDMNGDGNADLVADQQVAPFGHALRYSTGKTLDATIHSLGNFPPQGPPPGDGGDTPNLSYRWADFNGDGYADLLCCQEIAARLGTWWVPFDGTRLESAAQLTTTTTGPSQSWLDLNGDGMVDLALSSTSGQATINALYHQGPYPDLLAEVDNGIGGQTFASYAPITDPAVYSPDPDFVFDYAASPVREQEGPIYVLTRKHTNDGRLNIYSYDYNFTYRGSKLNMAGRGWLGFSRISALDNQTGVRVDTDYAQGFPETGLVLGETTTGSSGETLQVKTTDYTVAAPYTDVAFVERSEARLQYLSDGLSYTTGTRYSYDKLGNPVLTEFLGDLATPADDYAQCATYHNDTDDGAWLLGFPLTQVVAESCSVAADGACDCDGTLQQARFAYDGTDQTGGTLRMARLESWASSLDGFMPTDYTYDAYGNPLTVAAPLTGTTAHAYDAETATFAVATTNALGQVQRDTWDAAFGKRLSSTDANGVTRTQALDGFGRTVAVSVPDPDGTPTEVRRIKRVFTGQVSGESLLYTETRVLNGWGATGDTAWRWTRDYKDGLGRTYRTAKGSDADPARTLDTRTEFDNEARPARVSLPFWSDANPVWTVTEYDDMGRIARVTLPNGSVTTYDRSLVTDSASGEVLNKVVKTRAAGSAAPQVTTRYIDARGNPVRLEYAGGITADFQFDLLDRMIAASLPNAVTTAATYDSLNRQIALESSVSGSQRFDYDLAGHLTRQTNAAGETVAYTYDALDRVLSATQSTGQVTAYAYDQTGHGYGVGRLTSASVSDGAEVVATTYSYDRLGNIDGSTVKLDGQDYTQSQRHDPSGRVTSLTFPDGAVQTTRYQPIGFTAALALDDGSGAADFASFADYSAFGRPGTVAYQNGFAESFAFRDDGVVLRHAATGGTGVLFDKAYDWTALNQIASITDQGKPGWSYSYDALGYLSAAEGPLEPLKFAYSYDPAGNLTAVNNLKFAYDGQRLTSGSGDGTVQVAYDAAGRMAAIKGDLGTQQSFRYAADSRLDGSATAAGTAAFGYDHSGRRMRKATADGAVTLVPFAEYEIALTADGKRLATKYIIGPRGILGTDTVDAAAAAGYAGAVPLPPFGPGTNGPGVPEAGRFFTLHSEDGSTALVGDMTGAEVTRLDYDPYGALQVLTSRGPDIVRYKWVGREYDDWTGLYNLTSRYYDPVLARFTTPDRTLLGGTELTPAAFNRYAYGGGDPINNPDPNGDFFLIDDLIELIVVAAVGAEAAEAAASAIEVVSTVIEVTAATYGGGAAVNGSLNPGKWHWGSPKTYLGLVTGAVFGAFGGDIAEGIAEAAGGGFTGGLVGAAAESALENTVFQVETDPNPQQIAEQFFLGAVQGAAFHAIGEGLGALKPSRGDQALEPNEIEMTDFAVPRDPANGAHEGAGAAEEARAGGQEAAGGGACALSLVEGTPVATPEGAKPIEAIGLADWVLSEDADGQIRPFRVTGAGSRTATDIVALEAGELRLEITAAHPVALQGGGWVPAGEIVPGDLLHGADGAGLRVTAAAPLGEPRRVHSLEVEEAASYLAGDAPVLVHNVRYYKSCKYGNKGRAERIRARVFKSDIGKGSGTSLKIRKWARMMGLSKDDAGHIIAAALGGSGRDIRNIFPQSLKINRGAFRVWEKGLRLRILQKKTFADVVIVFKYPSAASTRPISVDYRYTIGGQKFQKTFGN